MSTSTTTQKGEAKALPEQIDPLLIADQRVSLIEHLRPGVQKLNWTLISRSPNLTTFPSNYAFHEASTDATSVVSEPDIPFPVVDFALLTSNSPAQSSEAVINHGVPEDLVKRMIDACEEFFDMEEDKLEFQGKGVLEAVRFGNSFNAAIDNFMCWKGHLKVPCSDVAFEYSSRTRNVVRKLLEGISLSLGLEPMFIDKALDLDKVCMSQLQTIIHRALSQSLTTHSDQGLLTLLVQNNIGAMVNNSATRISIAVPHGPELDCTVRPAAELVNDETDPAAYIGMKYRD
uniref:Non-haem dioxygenase N-terminal domain-containing protein n=1 Tax=Kalanchoe fedtschenkoi TaxID=63787 RepID=A0A7N0ZVD2_KALFE